METKIYKTAKEFFKYLNNYEAGKTILATAFNIQIAEKDTQTKLF